jgi:hypothetical protein
MESKATNFIRINHKNKLEFYTEEKLVEFKLNLYNKLTVLQDQDYTENLNKFMEKFITNIREDQIKINIKMAKKFFENNKNIIFSEKCIEIIMILDKILSTNYEMEIEFNKKFILSLSKILYYCFMEINKKHKLYNLKTLKELKEIILKSINDDISIDDYVIIKKENIENEKNTNINKLPLDSINKETFIYNKFNFSNQIEKDVLNSNDKQILNSKKSSFNSNTDSIKTFTKKSTFFTWTSESKYDLNSEKEKYNYLNKENFIKDKIINNNNNISFIENYKHSNSESKINNKRNSLEINNDIKKNFKFSFIENSKNSSLNNIFRTNKSNSVPFNLIDYKNMINPSFISENINNDFEILINSKKRISFEFQNLGKLSNLGFPLFLLLLVKKFMSIKKIILKIPKLSLNKNNIDYKDEKDIYSDEYAMVLGNIEWLFQNLLEVEIDFSIGNKSYFDKYFKVKFQEENSSIIYGNKFQEIVNLYKNSFDLLILICFYCSKLENLYVLNLGNYSCFYFEIDFLKKRYHNELSVIHVLDIFNNFCNLRKLNLSFNALDSYTFERIINLIQINNNLKSIDFEFKLDSQDFTINSLKRIFLKHYLFSYSQNRNNYIEVKSEINEDNRNNSYFKSLCDKGHYLLKNNDLFGKQKNSNNKECQGINKITLETNNDHKIFTEDLNENEEKNKKEIYNILNMLEENNDNKFMGMIINKFEPLLEELFYIIESKRNLIELNFNMSFPILVFSNDNFIITLQKFIFNLIKSLNNSYSKINTFKIKSKFLNFDNRKYPVIEKFINSINLQENNISISNFTLDLRINKISNFVNLIPKNVQYLNIGEIDIDTFSGLKMNYFEKEFFRKSLLSNLVINFSSSIVDKDFLI